MPTAQALVDRLAALPDVEGQRAFLRDHLPQLDPAFAEALKDHLIHLQKADAQQALERTGLLYYLAELTGEPLHQALALRVEAQIRSIEFAEHQAALDLYARAQALHQAQGDEVGQARIWVTKIWALDSLGRHEDAFAGGEWAGRVLRQHRLWRSLATLTMNLAAIHSRRGDDARALAMLDGARSAARELGPDGQLLTAYVEQNRGLSLRNLGRFAESIQASQAAYDLNLKLGQPMPATQARQTLAVTYFMLGRYNEALDLLEQVRAYFAGHRLTWHAVWAEMFTGHCLLELQRFAEVLETCGRARQHFEAAGNPLEVGLTLLNEAQAYAGLARFDEALRSFDEARRTFDRLGSEVWAATVALEKAALQIRQGQPDPGLAAAWACAQVFEQRALPVQVAQAELVIGRGLLGLGRLEEAGTLARRVIDASQRHGLPGLSVYGHQLLGDLASRRDEPGRALENYDAAIQTLEQLRGRLMVQHRSGFLLDKQTVYEDAVGACLALGRPGQGFEYAERAKSRSLLDMLALKLDLGLTARHADDQPLIDELIRRRRERDRLYRRSVEVAMPEAPGQAPAGAGPDSTEALAQEAQITSLWHRLLVRNADYAREAALWAVHVEPVQPYLEADTALVEYFFVRGRPLAFVVTRDGVSAHPLPADPAELSRWLRFLWHNFQMVPGTAPARVRPLEAAARGLLRRFDQALVAPLRDVLRPYRRWVVVPHGPLHYLPFHALHDGEAYLLEQHAISYLPAAGFLRYAGASRARDAHPPGRGWVSVGHSDEGRLPNTLREAQAIADLVGSRPLLEEAATLAACRAAMADCRVLHLAAHGEFRADNPLFSGLALADGWLTTFEIFSLRLQASLVCLSACQTGQTVVGGGDELMGLLPAFLHAGAASLVLSQWPVEDETTARLMLGFYRTLLEGRPKGDALRSAQLAILYQAPHSHPYFWAPFFLVGDTGPL